MGVSFRLSLEDFQKFDSILFRGRNVQFLLGRVFWLTEYMYFSFYFLGLLGTILSFILGCMPRTGIQVLGLGPRSPRLGPPGNAGFCWIPEDRNFRFRD